MKEFAVFWGCTIPARFPFIEKATRVMFDDLGARIHELRGSHLLPRGHARQGERPRRVLHGGRAQPRARREGRPRRRHAVQRLLLDVQGVPEPPQDALARARHDQRAARDRGPALRRQAAGRALRRVARRLTWVPGSSRAAPRRTSGACASPCTTAATCCARSPRCAGTIRCIPTKVEEIVRALGATVVDYPTKMQCCGGALDRVGERDSSLAFCRRKLHDLQNHDVDALVVVLPELLPAVRPEPGRAAARQRERQRPGALPLRAHRPRLRPRARGDRPGHAPRERPAVPRQVGGPRRRQGHARARLRRRAAQQVRQLPGVQGRLPGLQDRPDLPAQRHHRAARRTATSTRCIADGQLWKCLECYTCLELCHSDIGMAETFRKLKEIALREGAGPSRSPQSYKMFLETGTLGKPKQGARKKLGLEPLPASGGDAMARMMACDDRLQGV